MPFTHFYFVASAFLLALGSVLSKVLLAMENSNGQALNPLVVLTTQLMGGVTFLVAVRSVQGWHAGLLTELRRPLISGLIVGVGSIGTIFALALISASEASLIFATQPIIVLALAFVLLRERVSQPVMLLCFTAVAGVLLTVIGAEDVGVTGRFAGLVFALLSTSCAALYTVWMRAISGQQDLLTALIVVQAIACLVSAGAWISLSPGNPGFDGSVPIAFAALIGAIYYGAAFYSYLLGLKTVTASTAGIYLSLVPVFTIALARAVLSERLTALQCVGAAVVVIAVIAVFMFSREDA
ncbi:MAG: DMT family transporter [Pseudomonadota bacterium]